MFSFEKKREPNWLILIALINAGQLERRSPTAVCVESFG